MRKIKFRGFNKMYNRWVFGSLVETTHFIESKPNQHTKFWIVTSAFGNGGWFNVMGKINVEEASVGQFTGLFDKNGKEIYDLDLIEIGNYVYVVKIDIVKGLFFECVEHLSLRGGDIWYSDLLPSAKIKVIGNTYENKELLKETE